MISGQRVETGDIEDDLIVFLTAAMDDLGWDVTVSDQLAGVNTIAVYRVGGPMRDMVTDSATIVVECYARTKKRSSDMLKAARSCLHWLQNRDLNGRGVSRVQEFGGPALLPIDSAPTRYTVTLAIDIAADVVG